MQKIRILIVAMTLLVIAGSMETVEAQGRGKGHGKRGAVRVYHPVVVRKAHVRYGHLPRWGTVVTTMPPSAVIIRSGRNPYYFSNGIYYAAQNSGFVIVRPARGLRIGLLPVGYRTIVVGPRNYYYYYGTYYTKAEKEYKVVDPPIGAIIDALPEGYEIKTIKGTEYYEFDGVYYAEVDVPEFEGGVGYEVVKF